jgi:UDP-glucose 4-epimerase
VRANLLAATAPLEGAHAVNVATGAAISIADLAEMLARLAGRPELTAVRLPPRAGDILHSVAATDRAAALLGFRAEHGLEAGLRHLVERARGT